MNAKKIISIIIGLVAYIIVSGIFHELFRGKPDIAIGISYIYNDMLYVVGFVFTFMFYGRNKINRALFVLLSIIFLSLFIYNWWIASSMPYERSDSTLRWFSILSSSVTHSSSSKRRYSSVERCLAPVSVMLVPR